MEVGHAIVDSWCVNRQLLVVDAYTVAVSIGIGEEAGLQHWICRWLDSWHHVCWIKGYLLNLGEVVLGILVECEPPDLTERELGMWPDVSEVKDVDFLILPQILSFLSGHGLNGEGPGWEVAVLNGLVEVLLRVIWWLAVGLLLSEELGALIRDHMKLAVNPITGLVDQFDSVSKITVHVSITIWNTTVTHQDHDLMNRLWVLREIVPKYGGIISVSEVSGRVSLLGVNEVRKLGRISQEKDRSVVGNQIPVTLSGLELHRETSWITSTVVRSRLTTDSREPYCDWTLLSWLEHVCYTQVLESLGRLVYTVSSRTLSVNDTLWDTLAVEMGEEIDEVEVLEEKRTTLSDSLGLVWVWHWDTIAGSIDGVLGLRTSIVLIVAVRITNSLCGRHSV